MYLTKADHREIVGAINRMNLRDDEVVMILVAEKNRPDIGQMIRGLNKNKINFFGGVFPGVIHRDKRYEEGLIIKVLPGLRRPYLIKELDSEDVGLVDAREEIIGGAKKYTAILLVDGFSANIALFLSRLFNYFGDSVHYLGGGAGSLSLKQEPCIFTPEGFFQDAVVVTFIKLESKLGVRHGCKKLTCPLVATKTYKNVITELNWQSAYQVYKEIVEGDSGKKIPKDFYDISKSYPFGIYKEGLEDIVRDTIAVNENGELTCVGEVPLNTVLNILKGESYSLIQAAGQASDDCKDIKGKRIHCSLIFDCVSRFFVLGDDFARELEIAAQMLSTIDSKDIPEGVLTIGEISSYGEGYLEFFNKTIVIGVLYE